MSDSDLVMRREYERRRHRRRREAGLGSINIQGVPLDLRRRFAAACKLKGTSVERRLQALMEADIRSWQGGGE